MHTGQSNPGGSQFFSLPPTGPPYGHPRPTGVRAAFVVLAFFGGFLSGACLVGFVWIVYSFGKQPDTRNSPDHLLSPNSKDAIKVPAAVAPTRSLSAADLAFGKQQVERMVKDRPEMARYVRPTDPVWKYCQRAFAGEAIGQRVYWDSALPDTDETAAEHMGPVGNDPGYIRVREKYATGFQKGTPLTCEELWSSAVYELENIRGTKGFDALYKLACDGKLTREQWIRENTKLEYGACRRTAKLYRTLWLPVAKARGNPTVGTEWFADAPSTYEGWISLYTDPNGYPWNDWGRYYDDEVVPYLRSLNRSESP
jgi:hypothetical protein